MCIFLHQNRLSAIPDEEKSESAVRLIESLGLLKDTLGPAGAPVDTPDEATKGDSGALF